MTDGKGVRLAGCLKSLLELASGRPNKSNCAGCVFALESLRVVPNELFGCGLEPISVRNRSIAATCCKSDLGTEELGGANAPVARPVNR